MSEIILTVIVPTFNELNYIHGIINSINNGDNTNKEIFIVDGGSTDGTIDKVLNMQELNGNIHLVRNSSRYVSNGFNIAFKKSKGKYISLIGAHAIYPMNYFSSCIEAIQTGECDAAGGFLKQEGKTKTGKAISKVMSSKFGVGNTHFRTTRKKMYVDSVAFAVYDRKIFDNVGLLDEELIRNQDDEFHYRLNAAGYKMLMLPDLEVIYYVRNSLSKLYSQYYQYGFYKPLVFIKVSSGMKLRHLIPALFVLYLLTLPLILLSIFWLIPLCMYFVSAILISLFTKVNDITIKLKMIPIFPVLHIAYGLGFVVGYINFKFIN